MSKDNNKQSEFCQNFACDLQTCLDSKKIKIFKTKFFKKFFLLEHAYNPDKCEKVLNKLKQCCLEHGAQSPVVCSGFPTSKSSSSK
jgi:hypothetical protein